MWGIGACQDVKIRFESSESNSGLRLGAASDPTTVGGSGEAIIDPCGLPTTKIRLTERDAKKLKCGSLVSEILDGTVEFLLGAESVVIAPGGARLTIHEPFPGQYSVENSPDSFVPITLVTKGEAIAVQPGSAGVSMPIVDIKPGDGPNCIDPKSKGIIPIAIMGGNIDVRTIIRSSVELDGDTNPGTAGVKPARSAIEDANGDGINDLVMHFRTQDLNEVKLLTDGRTVYVTGQLSDGTLLVGFDVIYYLADGPSCN